MRKLMICLSGAAMVLLAPSLSNAAPFRSDAAPAAHNAVEQARLVRRCHIHRGRHGSRHRVCHMVQR